MLGLISSVEHRQALRRESSRQQVLALLQSFPRVRREYVTSSPPSFNLLELCGVGADERRHSAILAWLLDDTATHAQGNRFFKAFANLCGLELSKHGAYTVRAEFPGYESIADIVIFRPGDFFISIENKLEAGEGKDQLNREHRDLQRYAEPLSIPGHRRIAIFLTPDGRKPQTGDPHRWLRLSYPQLASAFRNVAAQTGPQKLSWFVTDWIASIQDLVLSPYENEESEANGRHATVN